MPTINIKGVIIPSNYQDIYDYFGMEATSPKSVNNILGKLAGENVDVEINSPGGDVFSGSEIYTALKGYQGYVTVKIVGVAASAAGVAAMGGNKVTISPTAQFMVHNVASCASGDYRDMQQAAEMLENYNKSIANAYQLKTGLEQKALLELMNKESWLNAQQAKELGFVDEIMFDNENKLVASMGYANYGILPNEVINKVRNLINSKPPSGLDKSLLQCRLNFLILKGEK